MAGTVTTTEETFGNIKKITFAWTASAGGAADATTTKSYSGVLSAYTVPDTGTAPSDDYDITLKDSNGADVAKGLLLNRDATNTEWALTGGGLVVNDPLILGVTNAGSGGKGTLVVFITPIGAVENNSTSQAIYTTAPRLATVTSASPLTTGTLFTYTGSIEILHIIGRVSTVIESQTTNVKLSLVPDAFSAYDICANKDINGFTVGSLLSITGTAANALVSTTSVGSIAPAQANPIVATCVTSGVIKVTYGAASTGAIVWQIMWRPLSSGATLV